VNTTGHKFTIGVVYEITGNPLFGAEPDATHGRLAEFANPTEVNLLVRSLKDMGFGIEIIDGPNSLINNVDAVKRTCDLVFNKSIGFYGLERKILVPAICQLYELPFVGTSAYPMTLARHKFHTNRLIHGLSINVPKAALFNKDDSVDLVCTNARLAKDRAEWVVREFSQAAIIEEFIGGEEWKVPAIGNDKDAQGVGVVGVMRNGRPIVGSLQTRSDVVGDLLDYYTPDDARQKARALELAVRVHNVMGLRDYSRTDFRIGDNDVLYCMEVSTHPEISVDSSFIRAAQQTLADYEAILNAIINAACRRYDITLPQ